MPDYENFSQVYDEENCFEVNMRVRHKTYGDGIVIACAPGREGVKVTVDFPIRGKKTIIGRFLEPIRKI